MSKATNYLLVEPLNVVTKVLMIHSTLVEPLTTLVTPRCHQSKARENPKNSKGYIIFANVEKLVKVKVLYRERIRG